MSPTKKISIKTPSSQFDKRGNSENQEHGKNDTSLGEILAIVIAALTLLVAIIPLFRCSRFRRWVYSFSIYPFVKKAPGITSPNPASTTISATENLSDIPVPEIPPPIFVYIESFNSPFVDTRSGAFQYDQHGITGEDGSGSQVEGSLGLGRPEPVILRQPRQGYW